MHNDQSLIPLSKELRSLEDYLLIASKADLLNDLAELIKHAARQTGQGYRWQTFEDHKITFSNIHPYLYNAILVMKVLYKKNKTLPSDAEMQKLQIKTYTQAGSTASERVSSQTSLSNEHADAFTGAGSDADLNTIFYEDFLNWLTENQIFNNNDFDLAMARENFPAYNREEGFKAYCINEQKTTVENIKDINNNESQRLMANFKIFNAYYLIPQAEEITTKPAELSNTDYQTLSDSQQKLEKCHIESKRFSDEIKNCKTESLKKIKFKIKNIENQKEKKEVSYTKMLTDSTTIDKALKASIEISEMILMRQELLRIINRKEPKDLFFNNLIDNISENVKVHSLIMREKNLHKEFYELEKTILDILNDIKKKNYAITDFAGLKKVLELSEQLAEKIDFSTEKMAVIITELTAIKDNLESRNMLSSVLNYEIQKELDKYDKNFEQIKVKLRQIIAKKNNSNKEFISYFNKLIEFTYNIAAILKKFEGKNCDIEKDHINSLRIFQGQAATLLKTYVEKYKTGIKEKINEEKIFNAFLIISVNIKKCLEVYKFYSRSTSYQNEIIALNDISTAITSAIEQKLTTVINSFTASSLNLSNIIDSIKELLEAKTKLGILDTCLNKEDIINKIDKVLQHAADFINKKLAQIITLSDQSPLKLESFVDKVKELKNITQIIAALYSDENYNKKREWFEGLLKYTYLSLTSQLTDFLNSTLLTDSNIPDVINQLKILKEIFQDPKLEISNQEFKSAIKNIIIEVENKLKKDVQKISNLSNKNTITRFSDAIEENLVDYPILNYFLSEETQGNIVNFRAIDSEIEKINSSLKKSLNLKDLLLLKESIEKWKNLFGTAIATKLKNLALSVDKDYKILENIILTYKEKFEEYLNTINIKLGNPIGVYESEIKNLKADINHHYSSIKNEKSLFNQANYLQKIKGAQKQVFQNLLYKKTDDKSINKIEQEIFTVPLDLKEKLDYLEKNSGLIREASQKLNAVNERLKSGRYQNKFNDLLDFIYKDSAQAKIVFNLLENDKNFLSIKNKINNHVENTFEAIKIKYTKLNNYIVICRKINLFEKNEDKKNSVSKKIAAKEELINKIGGIFNSNNMYAHKAFQIIKCRELIEDENNKIILFAPLPDKYVSLTEKIRRFFHRITHKNYQSDQHIPKEVLDTSSHNFSLFPPPISRGGKFFKDIEELLPHTHKRFGKSG